ncbi:S1 family peptidase [Priestia megaterium]|uniref:S1 family peptidase n=1 Tax=Priestia megaterium TaxID=1404 RepID=UPI0030026F14
MAIYNDITNVVITVARITPNGTQLLGTATLLNKSGHFVTAAHITGMDDTNLVILSPHIEKLSDYQDTSEKEVRYANVKIVALNPLHDLCIFEVKTDRELSSTINISSLDEMNVGDSVTMFGFPDLNFNRRVLTQQNTNIGAKILLENSGEKLKHAVINIQSRQGQSGSPVFNSMTYNLIGILVGSYVPHNGKGGLTIGGLDPLTFHPATHIISAEYIKELMNYE